MIRFGKHCSLRDGLPGALEEAASLKCQSIQIFTRSPRVWKMRVPSEEETAVFKKRRKELDIRPLVVHSPYLPNLATGKESLYSLSKQALKDDLSISEQIEADYLVIHPGAFSEGFDMPFGIKRVSSAINEILKAVPGRAMILLENVAGGGRRVGGTFEQLAEMTGLINDKKRIGICLDTAHTFGAGYDIGSAKGVDAVLAEFDRVLGLENLRVIHFNDSKVELGSFKDRHQHLGKGHIGEAGFKRLIKKLRDTADAGIIETPRDSERDDKDNLAILSKWMKIAG